MTTGLPPIVERPLSTRTAVQIVGTETMRLSAVNASRSLCGKGLRYRALRDGEVSDGPVSPAHVEGIWVEEGYRDREVADNLMKKAEIEARSCHVKRLFAYAISPAIERRLSGLGYKKQDLTVFVKEL